MKREIPLALGMIVVSFFAVAGIVSAFFLNRIMEEDSPSERRVAVERPRLEDPEPDEPEKADDENATKEGVEKITEANNELAFDLYGKLSKENENLLYSPYGIFSMMAVVYEGAKEETAEEIRETLRFPEKETLRPNFARTYNLINKDGRNYDLEIGNALWVQEEIISYENYLEDIERYYRGEVRSLDFVNKTEEARRSINDFTYGKTDSKIGDLVSDEDVDADTKMIATSAIYFTSEWMWEFNKEYTVERDFYTTPGNSIETSMMLMEPERERFNYVDTPDAQVLELPYENKEASMLIILPKEDVAERDFLTVERFTEYKEEMEETKVYSILIPKFEIDAKYSLESMLSTMGMPSAFLEEEADFSDMTEEDLFIDSIIHRAIFSANEDGAESILKDDSSMEEDFEEQIVFEANRPFTFIVQENETENILFIGKVYNPTQ